MGRRAGPRHPARRRHVLYNLANVVDDYDMKITHVIRAEEHLSNTPRQIFIAQGLGYPLPEYAHVPFVAEPGSKNKLSKRKIAAVPEEPGLQEGLRARQGHRRPPRPDDRGRHVQPGDRRFLRAGRLPARRDHELPGAARLVARRQDGVLHTAGDDRAVLAGARQQGAGQLRREEAVRVPGALHAGAAGRGEGASGCCRTCSGPAWCPTRSPRRRVRWSTQIVTDAGPRLDGGRRHPELRRLLHGRRPAALRREGVRQAHPQAAGLAAEGRGACWRRRSRSTPRR